MKFFAVFAVLFAVAAAGSIQTEDEDVAVGERIPASAALEALQKAIEDGIEFVSVNGALIATEPEDNLLFRKLKKCSKDNCRKNCNKQRLNGGCVLIRCVCWKTAF